jgi:hypothetical protein
VCIPRARLTFRHHQLLGGRSSGVSRASPGRPPVCTSAPLPLPFCPRGLTSPLSFLPRVLHTTLCTLLRKQALGGYSALTPSRPPDPILGEPASPSFSCLGITRVVNSSHAHARALGRSKRHTAHTPRRSHRCVQEGPGEEQGQPGCRCVWRLRAVSRSLSRTSSHSHVFSPSLPLQAVYCHPHPAFCCAVILV